MAHPTLLNKISSIVPQQLPEHIRSSYPTFITFLEAYYEYLQQQGQAQEFINNTLAYKDIDRTTDAFVQYFLKEYCDDLPTDVLVDKQLVVKNIRQLYNSKGNQKAFELLFRLLFNKSIDFAFPGQKILRASDGRWTQDVTMFVQTIVGDPDSIVGATVKVVNATGYNTVYIKDKKTTTESIDGAQVISTDKFQYFIDNSNNIPIAAGDIIEYGTFRGLVLPTTTNVSVITGGSGFKVGDVFTVRSGDGVASIIKISKVSSSGAILACQFIEYGVGYDAEFFASFSSTSTEIIPGAIIFGTESITMTDNTDGFIDEGALSKYDYAFDTSNPAFEPSYCGNILRTFLNDSREVTGDLNKIATIYITLGAKAAYAGYFKTNDGFLSDDIHLQDRDYYQPYSYVISIDEQIHAYKKAVLDIIHPAGTKLFGNFRVTNDYNTTLTAETVFDQV